MLNDPHHKAQYKNVALKDHHVSKTGRRASFDKKHGAGKNNWGSIDDLEIGQQESIDYFGSN